MHIQKERQLLLTLSLVFAVMAFALFGYGLTTKASELVAPESYQNSLYAMWSTNNGGEKYSEYELDITSDYPCVGYYTANRDYLVIRLVDLENHTAYVINNEDNKDLYFINKCSVQSRKNADGSAVGDPIEYKNVSYEPRYMNFVCPYFGTQGGLTKFTGAIFKDEASFLNYVETGNTSGMEKPDDNAPPRDFGSKYDPSVPIPQLKNLSHNGFTVANAADDLELDLVVQSYFYGLDHTTVVGVKKNNRFCVDSTDLVRQHRYETTCNTEIGFTGSKVVLNQAPFDCSNQADLFADGIEYFETYPTHNKLPDYTWKKHSASEYDLIYATYTSKYKESNANKEDAFETSGQAVTKYYVRFYQLKESETAPNFYVMTPGQWYCYTYNTKNSTGISPVEGDPTNGAPIETDPIDGWQDDDGNPIYTDPNLPNIDTSNPVQMLQDFIDFLVGLPSQLGQISLFLKDAFCFIPEKYWGIIITGVGFTVVFLIFKALK